MSELATIPNSNGRLPSVVAAARQAAIDIVGNKEDFEHFQRVAKMYQACSLIPEHLRANPANVMVALLMAREMGEEPVVVMQSIYFVKGKAGWAATYMIGRANRSGKFRGGIRWRQTGQGDSLVVTAAATLADTGEEVTVDCSMKMAKAESWTDNKKYQSMPDHMLKYRAATMLVRLYAPEVMLGIKTVDELEDVGDYSDADIPTGNLSDIINELPPALPAPTEPGSLADIMQGDEQPKLRDVSTWMLFEGAMEAHARVINADPENFDAMMSWIALKNPDVKKLTKPGQTARESFYADFVAGKKIGEFQFGGVNG